MLAALVVMGCTTSTNPHVTIITNRLTEPFGLAATTDGVAVQVTRSVVLVDEQGAVSPVDPHALGASPVAAEGHIFYAAGDGTTTWIARHGLGVVSPDADFASGLAAGGGYIYWVRHDRTIMRVADSVTAPTPAEVIGQTPSYANIAVGPDGTVFFGAQDGIYTAGGPLGAEHVLSASNPRLAASGSTLWVVQPGSGATPDGEVDMVDLKTMVMTVVADHENSPNLLAVDPDSGRVFWTCDFGCDAVRTVTPGSPAHNVAIAFEPWGIGIANGTIYFVDSAFGLLASMPLPVP